MSGDLSFHRSVILLAEHNQEGSVGFILNKPLDYRINQIINDIKVPLRSLQWRPVEQDNLYFIHKVPHLINDSFEIADGIYWGGDFDKIIGLLNNEIITDNDIRFFLGYTGWSALQLDQELDSNSWVVLPNDLQSKIIQNNYSSNIWKEKMLELGGEYLIWSNSPENPNLN